MVDQYRTIIGFQYEGQGEVQKYLDALSTVAQRTASMQGVLSRPAEPGAFAGVTAADIGAAVQGYDVILRKAAELQKARLAQERMEATLARRTALDPGTKGYIDPQGPLAQEMRLGAATRIDKAAEALATALRKQGVETEKAVAAAQRAALLGPGATFQGSPIGPFAQAQQRLLQAAADGTLRAKQEERDAARQAAAIEKQAARDLQANANARRATGDAILRARREARDAIAKNAATDAAYAGFQTSYPSADPTTRLGQAQGAVNRAERAYQTAVEQHAAAHNAKVRDLAKMRQADQQLETATGQLETARRAVAAATAAQARTSGLGGGGGSFGSNFMTGFHGRADRPYAEQLGQAFKFSVFYGTAYKLLFAFTTTLQQTVQEGIEFQKAMTELKIASGQSADAANDIAQSLSAEATAAGAAPSQGVMIGARSLGLFGATAASGASAAEQERIAEISARVVSRMALGSKTDPMELQTQIAAVANAFGGGAQGQIRAYDLDAYLGRRFGVMPGETIRSVAESGTVGQAAGFNQEEVFAIAAALQSRTGQTSSAVAGWMAQIFSRGGEGTLTALTGRFGIDQTADLATQIEELARIYKNASNTERAAIAAGFGRGKVQNAAVVMLDEFDTIMREAQSARTGATGEGDRIFELRMSDIGGQIQETIAVLKAFASELGRSGVLDVLGGVIVAFRELVRAATDVLELWNQVPGAIKAVIASLALLTLANRHAAALGGASLVSRAGLIGTPVGNAMGVAGPATQAAAGAGTGLLAAGRAAMATVGPFALAIGGLLAVGALKSSADRMREAQEAASTALQSSGLTRESTSADYIGSASELDMLAQRNREATGWFHNFITAGQADNRSIDLARQLEIEADRRRRVADAIDARAAANPTKAPAIADFQADTIKEALDLVTASGGDANDRLRLLTDALDGTGDAAVRAAAAIDEDFAGRMATLFKDGVAGITEAIPMSERVSTRTQLGTADARRGVEYQVTPDSYTLSEDSQRIPGEMRTIGEVFEATQTELENRLRKELVKRNIDSLADLDRGTSKELAESIVEDSDFDERLSGDQLADARGRIVNMIARQLRGEALQWRKLLKKNHDLTAEEVATIGESIDTEFEASREQMPEFDLAGRAASWRRQLARLNQTRSQAGAGEDISGLMVRIGRAKAGLARAEIERLDQVRRAAQQNATSAAQIRRIGMRTIRGRVAAAIESGDVDVLAEVISNSGKVGVRIARKAIDVAIAAAREAIQIQAAYAAIQSYAAGVAGMIGGIAGSMDAMAELAGLQELRNALGNMAYGSAEETLKGTDVEGTGKFFPEGGGKSPEDRKAEREAARQEMLDLKNNLYLLSIDLSDPLAMATAAVKDARRRLQSDIASGQDRGTVAASRVALRQAEIEREATAFQQRLEAMQTAEELGRISHRKYISYLESERKRLGAIKDRTYQQQQQLDEIDRLMKDAAEQMQGQWNFGDIKLPTPYQVRRQVEQMRLDRATQLDATSGRVASSVTTINIDGADVGKVRQIITETLGRSNQTVTTRPRRR